MTRLGFDQYLHHISEETGRFRSALVSCDPQARVPTCPDWTATDLLWHLGHEVQHFWAHVITHRPAPPADYEEITRPDSFEAVLETFDRDTAAFLDALGAADPAEPAWSWAPEQTVGFSYRRQAHEALIHRIDAELTAGLPVTPPDPALAADGVDECLAVMYGGTPPWGSFTPGPHRVLVDLTDAAPVRVALGRFTGTEPDGTERDEPDLEVVAGPSDSLANQPAVRVTGTAAAVDRWVWQRSDTESGVTVEGDQDAIDHLLGILRQPLD